MPSTSQKTLATLRAALLAGAAFAPALPAVAEQNPDPAAIARLMERLEQLERRQAEQARQIEEQKRVIEEQKKKLKAQRLLEEPPPPLGHTTAVPANVVTGGDKPGSFKLPGSDTSIKIGGYVKADLIYDIGPDTGDSFAASSIPADGSAADEREGSFRAHARQTRINITTWTPTDYGEVQTFVEGDFFGGGGNERLSNSTSFRLRHAYGQVGPVLAGQTWSLFMPLASYPSTLDFFGPAGLPFVRQGQLRYTYDAGNGLKIAGSVENSELAARNAAGQLVGSDGGDVKLGIDTLPDFVAAIEYANEGWSAKLSGVARLLDLEGAGAQSDSEFGWGVHADAVIPTFGEDSLQLNFTYGDGIGRYIINGVGNDGFVDAGGDFETIEAYGIAIGYTRQWSEHWQSNLVYGRYEALDTFLPTDTETVDTVHVNLIWQPSDRFRYGIEYIFGHRGFDDGDLDNDAHRVQFSGQFFF